MTESDGKDPDKMQLGMSDLPEELLEHILSFLSPYRDYKNAMLVCKLWHQIMIGVSRQEHENLLRAIQDGCSIDWSSHMAECGPTISERYSHSACYLDKSLYVFGGCTSSSTTFNDLWRFDLGQRQWVRPLAVGTYPSPKACASMVAYNDSLILFGGWSHPTPYPLHQAARFFKELHIYSVQTNRWSYVVPGSATGAPLSPPATAGHSASIVAQSMVVFGGSHGNGVSCNELWVLDLEQMSWRKEETLNPRPLPRYGHSQLVLDDQHILVIGGCGGPNMQFTDIWLLSMDSSPWCWRELTVQNVPENAPNQLWCHAACKVGERVVVLSKTNSLSPKAVTPTSPMSSQGHIRLAKVYVPPRDEGQDGAKRHQSKRRLPETSESSSSDNDDVGMSSSSGSMKLNLTPASAPPKDAGKSVAGPEPCASSSSSNSSSSSSFREQGASSSSDTSPEGHATAPVRGGMPSVRPNAMKNRQRQLEALKRYEELIKGLKGRNVSGAAAQVQEESDDSDAAPPAPTRRIQNPMHMHTLDISRAIKEGIVSWQPVCADYYGVPPEETIFYSLVCGRGELVMFGGIQTDLNNMQRGVNIHQQHVSNGVYCLGAHKPLR